MLVTHQPAGSLFVYFMYFLNYTQTKMERNCIPYPNLAIRLGRTTGTYLLLQKFLKGQIRIFSYCGMYFHLQAVLSFRPQLLCVSLTFHWKGFAQEINLDDFITAVLSIVMGKRVSDDWKSLSGSFVWHLDFRTLWTFLDPHKTPSVFCRGLPGTQSDSKSQLTEMGHTVFWWFCSF